MAASTQYDVIIVGGGPMGLASAYELASKEGKTVLLLERFDKFANEHGSSPGYSRQFRVSYSEKYLCDMALKTYHMWKKLMQEMKNTSLLQLTGCLWFGDPSVESGEGNIDEAIKNLKELGQNEPDDYKVLAGKTAIMADPEFKFVSQAVTQICQEDNAKALFTVQGGTVNVPAVVECYRNVLDTLSNATLITKARVTKIDHTNANYVEVTATVNGREEKYCGKKIILTPGTYVNEVLDALEPRFGQHINLTIYLWASTYFTRETGNPSGNDPAMWPIWYFFGPKDDGTDDGSNDPLDYNDYYGFPSEPDRPQYLRAAAAFTSKEEFDYTIFPPATDQRPVDTDALDFTSNFARLYMPDLSHARDTGEDTTCVAGFAEVADESAAESDEGAGFVLDFLPNTNRILVFTGGWAMKFVPIIGKILSDLAICGDTKYRDLIQPWNIGRGVLTDASSCQAIRLKPASTVQQKAKVFRKIWC